MPLPTSYFNRRSFLAAMGGAPAFLKLTGCGGAPKRPNILFAISDDQSFPHVSAAGDPVVKTPAFDRIAEHGVMFTQAFSGSPGCAPSRAAILTGRPHWQLGEAGTHAAHFPTDLEVYPEVLKAAGYHVGSTGKGAGPANFEGSGWAYNPAGQPWQEKEFAKSPEGIRSTDYAANFEEFLRAREPDQPFCFWYGGSEPHRQFQNGIGLESGKKLHDVKVPGFLPDCDVVRSDILDYYYEIEWFDTQLERMLNTLEAAGELENTLVVSTSDNGMAFPRAKATMFEYGFHLPLAVSWPAVFSSGGRTVDDIVSFTDFAPTFLEAAGVAAPPLVAGRSFLDVLRSEKSGRVDESRTSAFSGRERHSHARFDNLGYPTRALRTHDYLYIRNFAPDRMPAGDPDQYYDIDASPSKSYLLDNKDDPAVKPFFEMTCGQFPGEQLFDIKTDAACLKNLAEDPDHAGAKAALVKEFDETLTAMGDPRMTGKGDVFESYPRFSRMRPELGGFAEQGEYNPKHRE